MLQIAQGEEKIRATVPNDAVYGFCVDDRGASLLRESSRMETAATGAAATMRTLGGQPGWGE